MERKEEEVYAVKFTNADIGSALEIDPDGIAASVDVFCYSGETRKVHIIGSMRYKVHELDNIDWTMKLGKSYEEVRLLHYYPQLIGCHSLKVKELELREKSVFNILEMKPSGTSSSGSTLKPSLHARASAVRRRPSLPSDINMTGTIPDSLGKIEETRHHGGSSVDGGLDKSTIRCHDILANSEPNTKSVTSSSLVGEQISTGPKPVIKTSSDVIPSSYGEMVSARPKPAIKTHVSFSSSSLLGEQVGVGLKPAIKTSSGVIPSSFWNMVDARPKLVAKTRVSFASSSLLGEQVSVRPKTGMKASSAVDPESQMDQSHDKPTEGVREFNESVEPVGDKSKVNDMAMLYDIHPIISSSKSNLGLYEEDAKDSLVSLLCRYIGLSYLRNPYDVDDLSVALPTDTLIGVWDRFEGFFKSSRVVPHGKGTLLTTDDRVIYVGDFKNGKRCGYGTAMIVEKWTDPYHGIGYYQGHWMDNCRHGFGCLELVSGMRYNGEWYLDRPQGKGMLIYPDGSILKGYFAGGLSEGAFTYYSREGYIDLVDFKGGSLVRSRPLQKMDYRNDSLRMKNSSSRGKKNDSMLLFHAEGKPVRRSQPRQYRSLKSLSDTNSKSEIVPSEDPIAYEDESCFTKEEPLMVNDEEHLVEIRQNDVDSISGEIDLDDLLEHLVSMMQYENEFFVKHQMSKVKMYCEDLLSTAHEELCKVSEKHTRDIANLDVVISTQSKLKEVEAEMDKLTIKFDGIVDLSKSILDGQEKTESRISALDVHVAEMNEEKERETIEKLREDLKQKQDELSIAESSLLCHVCQDKPRDCVLMPCMHMQTCSVCVRRIRQKHGPTECPICRTTIQGEVHVKPN